MSFVFIKAEANDEVGGGHLFRSLALAKKIWENGIPVKFIFSETPKHLRKKVYYAGFKSITITKEQQLDPNVYLKFLPNESLILFDTDNFRFHSGNFIEVLKSHNIKTACFAVTDQYEISTDILINPNIVSKLHNYKTPSKTKKLLGPSYMLYKEEFRHVKTFKKNIVYPSTLIIVFGNADAFHLTIYFLKILPHLKQYLKKLIVVCGGLNSDVKTIKSFIKSQKSISIELHNDVNNMVPLYEQADLAITSAGMALWEIALYNIPQIVFASSPREIIYSDYLNKLNYIYKIGEIPNKPSQSKMKEELEKIFSTKKLELLRTTQFNKILNPNGIDKITKALVLESTHQ